MELNGKTAIITGAGRGIGKAIAAELARAGVHVGLIARSQETLDAAAQDIRAQHGVTVHTATADVGDRHSVEDAIERLTGELGSLDILVNNAGIATFGSVVDMDPDVWEQIIRVNLLGTYYATRAALPHMMKQKSGNIINIASTAGEKGAATASAYAASKAGMIAFTESLMLEARKHDIRTILINPSTVNTDLAVSLGLKIGEEERMLQAEDLGQLVVAALSLPQRALVRNLSLITTNPQ